MPQNNNDFKHNLKYDFKSNFDHDLGDLLDNAVQFGTGVGATVLGSLSRGRRGIYRPCPDRGQLSFGRRRACA